MLQRFVAKWLREQAQEALMQGLRPAEGAETDGPTPQGERETVYVACFFPAADQAAGLVDLLKDSTRTQCHGFVEHVGTLADRRVAVIEAPLPHSQLSLVVRDVISVRKPDWTLASGFATAVKATVSRGDLIVANRLIDAAGYSLAIDTKMPASKRLHVGALLTQSDEVSEADGATEPSTQPDDVSPDDVLACDLQSAVVGEVCRVLKTRMMAVHCAAFKLGDVDGALAKGISSQDTLAGIVGVAAGALIDSPSSIKELLKGKEAKLVFADRLAKFLVGIIGQLP